MQQRSGVPVERLLQRCRPAVCQGDGVSARRGGETGTAGVVAHPLELPEGDRGALQRQGGERGEPKVGRGPKGMKQSQTLNMPCTLSTN